MTTSNTLPLEYHILCVDDDRDFLKSVEFFLPDAINGSRPPGTWYRFHFLDEPSEAVGVFRELETAGEIIAMVICDQKMPRMKGTELFAEIRQMRDDSVRVLLTGDAGIESAIQAINDHLLDKYLTKPIEDESDFTINIQHLLQRFHMRRVLAEQEQFIRRLYEFSNTLNKSEQLQETLDNIASFAKETLCCNEVSIRLVDGGASVAPALAEMHTGSNGAAPVSMPLLSGERSLGVLSVKGRNEDRPFTDLEHDMLTYIANTASIALHNQISRIVLEGAYVAARNQAVALSDANARLQIVDRLKMDFLDFISHELRTPLSLMSAIDLFEKCEDATQRASIVEIIRSGYERLDYFIKTGLDYFKWFATDHVTTSETTDLQAVVRKTAAGIPGFREAGVDFELSLSPASCVVNGNEEHLKEVVCTLLENALKFSPAGKVIRVTLGADSEKVTLTVTDHGVGFAPEWARELFLPFTITDSAHHAGGTAMNLAKASAIVKAHGGCITATSDGVGKGATFRIELPAVSNVLEPATATIP